MRRIKIFMDERDYDVLEKRVNSFLATLPSEKILDIQYRDCCNACSVMVVYEDETSKWMSTTSTTFDEIYGGKR